ncbi:hypothetical protein ACFOZY_01935 [Chungangia koreensis]|uniref:Uncharacterized protein n=1 Tax=Chungangia koreensis TaxID=752657 RepID=A0ABV8X561_9LACT
MTTIMIIFLFILQLVSLFLIAMLYTKLGKFNELKKQQDMMMREMEDAVGAYLVEIKDENDRLLSELSTLKSSESQLTEAPKVQKEVESPSKVISNRIVPKSKAVNTYRQLAANPKEQSKEEQALELSKSGYTVDEVAKQLNMGKTEVELLLKFRS